MNRTNLYMLDEEGNLVGTDDTREWAEWFEKADRTVEKTEVGDLVISTVFLSSNHNFYGNGPPILWETMIFTNKGRGIALDFQDRYVSVKEAREGHQKVVETVREVVKSESKEKIPTRLINMDVRTTKGKS